MTNSTNKPEIRTRGVPACSLCGSEGSELYANLVDRLFTAPGVWGSKKCSNSQCGLVWLDPAPVTEDIHLAYASYYTHSGEPAKDSSMNRTRYAWQGYRALVFGSDKFPANIKQKVMGACFFLLPNRKPAVEYPIRQMQGMPTGRILEIGCGAGDMLHEVNGLGWKAVGIDFDAAAVEAARGKGLDVRVGDLTTQAFADESFDVVMMNHVIEHLPDPVKTLREIKRILRPSGRLIGITPNAESWGHKRFGKDWLALHPPQHLHIFTQQSLLNAVHLAGFEQAKIKNSVMSAISILRDSVRLHSPSTNPLAPSMRIYLEAIWLWEWILTLKGERAGEILVFVVEKKK